MNIENNSSKESRTALIILSIISLVFSVEVLIQCIINHKDSYLNHTINSILLIIVIFIIIIYAFYCILSFKNKLTLKQKFRIPLEILMLILIFGIVTIISGGDESSFKALFIFAIISAVIRKGLKAGIIVAIISSASILAIDFVFQQISLTGLIFQDDLVICTMLMFCACMFGYYINISNSYKDKLQSLANKDGLTGVYNHRYFYDKLEEAINISELNSQKLSLMFLDIDDFKHYNDSNGHQEGDTALKKLANILESCVRKDDIVARYGGEEFVVLMKDTKEDEAIILAEKVRLAVESAKFYGEKSQPLGKLTVSIGISKYPDKAKNGGELVKMADTALYRAKSHNKNKVEA